MSKSITVKQSKNHGNFLRENQKKKIKEKEKNVNKYHPLPHRYIVLVFSLYMFNTSLLGMFCSVLR